VLALAAVLPAALAAPAASRAQEPPTLRTTGYLQPRFQAVGDTAVFFLRRARFAVEGNLAPWAFYRAQVEMRTAGAAATPARSPLTLSATDLFIRLSHDRWSGTVGQFRVPFSLEALLSSTALETTERSLVVFNAAPNRDIGVQLEWRVPDRLTLQASVVNGEGTNRATNPDNRMAYLGRAVVTPVKGWDVGGAVAAYADSTDWNLQTMLQRRRWKARAEYVRDRERRTDVRRTGWYVLGAYLLRPDRFQVVGRVEQFDPDDQVASDRETGYGLGTQYFIRGDNLKIMADYTVFREQVTQLSNDRFVVQMQARW